MHTVNSAKRMWGCTAAVLVLTLAAYTANQFGYLTPIRLALHNAMSPGRLTLAAITSGPAERTQTQPSAGISPDEVALLQEALLKNELQRRQLLIENADLHNRLRSANRLASVAAINEDSLVDFVSVRANILSRTGFSSAMSDTLIDAGKRQGLTRSQIVVEGTGMMLDKGKGHGLKPDQKVVHGMAVVGRLAQVSQWVSLVQPVTDAKFSAAVQLVRMSPSGVSLGARGILEGMGSDKCRMTGVAFTEAVSVGDEVFSADIDGLNGPKLYFGKVTRADFLPGGQWDIEVEPVQTTETLNNVAVVQPHLNVRESRTPTALR